jgi:cellulose synthase/poly-beta-1,6-N-acetylglucosamine synthase-like glycosyltransferase
MVENGTADLADTEDAYGIVRYVHLSQANSAAARNAGLALARGRFLLLTDADCVAERDWIEKMTRRFADGSVAAVGGSIRKYQDATLDPAELAQLTGTRLRYMVPHRPIQGTT